MSTAQRRIAVVTGTRSDYGLYYYILRGLQQRQDVELQLIVTGMHLAPQFGLTIRDIERDGFPIAARVEMLFAGDTGASAARSAAVGMLGMTQALESLQPDLLLLLGDRTEMLAAATAALHMSIPIAHTHGGESTEGAIDESIRHALTKMAHLHLAASELYGERIRLMGEEPWRIHVTGAPGLDHLHRTERMGIDELTERLGIDFTEPVVLATFHPVTMETGLSGGYVCNLLDALEPLGALVLFTAPNSDAGGREILAVLQDRLPRMPRFRLVSNLGSKLYFSVMAAAAVMVGNSSSGIIEAPSLGLPVVNIGTRQDGRLRAENVIDVGYSALEIRAEVEKALYDAAFRAKARSCTNPYGDGHASDRIVELLTSIPISPDLLRKRLAY